MITNQPKKILLADDTESFRSKMSDLLTEAGHAVVHARDGDAVIEELRRSDGQIGVLILDIDMSGIDGFGVLEKIRECGFIGKFPILCVTSKHEEEDVSAYVKGLGAQGVLAKESSHARMVAAVNKALFSDVVPTRKSTRVYRTIPAKFMLGAAAHEGSILNISGIGIFMHTALSVRPCSVMKVVFSLGEGAELAPSGTVRWVTGGSIKDSRFTGAGVEFKNLTRAERVAIEEFVEQHAGDAAIIR